MKGIRNTLLIIVVSLTSLNSIAQKRIRFKSNEWDLQIQGHNYYPNCQKIL